MTSAKVEINDGWPFFAPEVFHTSAGTAYLQEPGVHLISRPNVELGSLTHFLAPYDAELKFMDYLNDPTLLPAGTQLIKTAGQACYASWGPKRSKNDRASAYMENIKDGGHGSVLEHANYSFFLYGISRSNTHEIVRHRAGAAYSQLSQRYVSGKVLRFVERPEYCADPELHQWFCERIDRDFDAYHEIADYLERRQADGEVSLSADRKTDRRKRVQQTARSILPNEVETQMVMTCNVRAWRHMIEMRSNEHAETEIRELFTRIYLCLREVEPILFEDYSLKELGDGTVAVEAKYRKV